jgi:hypothetical protein
MSIHEVRLFVPKGCISEWNDSCGRNFLSTIVRGRTTDAKKEKKTSSKRSLEACVPGPRKIQSKKKESWYCDICPKDEIGDIQGYSREGYF